MKKILSLFLLLMLPCMYVAAKLEGSGYYRIWNAAVLAKKKEKAFCCVTYNAYYMNTAAGTQQDIDAIPLYPEQYSFTDPAAIIYVQMPDATHKFDLMAQGVSVSKILDGSSLSLSGNADGNYVLTGKVKGVDSPVYSTSYKTGFYGPRHYILTSANSDVSYKYWGADKVDSESATNYFGVKPTLSAKGKYYAPYYVSFPFETVSEGMKVYYVSKVTKSGYTLEEIKGIVPAATPVLIECSSDDPSKNRLRLHEPGTPGAAVAGNKLQGIYFRNPDLGITLYKNSVTQFQPATMRIWNVVNDELVLSNDGSSLLEAEVAQGVKYVCLNANQSYLTVPADYSATMREGQLDPVTVTFLDDNGTVLKTVQGIPGDNITLPDTPVKTGYSFAGWEGLNGVFPETSMTVKPVWAINQYTITFDVDGGEEVSPITQNYGTTVTAPASPVKEGHTFLCWEPTLPQTMPANNVTVKAKWQVNKYTVRFLSDNGEVIKETTQDYGSAIVLPEPPTKVGAEFVRWTPEPVATVPANDVTYTAVFTGTEYTITFDTDGAGDIPPLKGFYGDAVKKPADPAKEGYTFLGWEPEIPATFSGSMTVKAKWQINQYTITFNTDGGSDVASVTGDYGTEVASPDAPVKYGYTFKGWNPELPTVIPGKNLTVKAQWEAVRQEHSVSVADGWNWISIPLMDEDMTDLNTLFANGTWALGDEIKTKTAIALYSEAKGSWLGALAHSKLSGTTMYKVRSAKQQDLSLKEGRMTVPSEMTVTVNSGWNYFSYLPAEPMFLAEALANYPAAEGDVIKTEKGSNVYSSTDGWKGELTALYPGQGYMLLRKGANAVTFRYPNEAQTPVEIDVAKTASRYADNMTVIATLTGIEPESGDSLVATVGGEVRGVSAVAEGGKTVLTVQGSGSERVSVALMRGGEVYATANTSLCYETDAVVGSLANPTAISFVEDDNADKALAAGNVTAIYSSDGRRQNTTDLNTLAPGTYIVYAEADGMTNIIKTSIKR